MVVEVLDLMLVVLAKSGDREHDRDPLVPVDRLGDEGAPDDHDGGGARDPLGGDDGDGHPACQGHRGL